MGRDLAVRAYFDPDHQRGFLRIGDYTSKMYHAWKAQLADLDADGVSEVVLGVWSRQRRHDEPEPHRSVWVLRWDPERASLIEIWRGSALARPLVDFSIRDQGLIAHEHIADRCYETTYAWTGFGFAVEEARPIACGGP